MTELKLTNIQIEDEPDNRVSVFITETDKDGEFTMFKADGKKTAREMANKYVVKFLGVKVTG